jgi:hypothetical protein
MTSNSDYWAYALIIGIGLLVWGGYEQTHPPSEYYTCQLANGTITTCEKMHEER